MQIIHIVECFAGGVFEFLSTLTQGLPENTYIIIHGRRKNTPLNYKKRFPQSTIFIPWGNVQREISLWKDGKALVELIKILKKYSTTESIIHLHSSKAGFLGRLAGWLLGKGKTMLYTAHGAAFLRMDISKSKHIIYVYLEKIAGWFGGTIIACSNSEGKEFKKCEIKNVIVINNGIKIEKLEKNFLKKKERVTIGTVGRITYQKNPKQFNKIAEKFVGNKKIEFRWIGDGELRDELKSSNIEVTGWLEKRKVKKELKKIDVYLSTSLWEGMPLAVLEAMGMGKPVILSNCVGNRDLACKSEFLCNEYKEYIEKIELIIKNKEEIELLGLCSYEKCSREYSMNKMLDSYSQFYKHIKL